MNHTQQEAQPRQYDREKTVKREITRLLVAGGLFVLFGALTVAVAIAEANKLLDPMLLSRLIWLGVIISSLALVILSSRSITKVLLRSSQDEYEFHLNNASKAKAYNFLYSGVLLTVIFLGGTGRLAIGLIALILGISWIITAREGGQLDV